MNQLLTEPANDRQGHSRWSVGSLTYTSAGLVVLFLLLLLGDFGWMMRERSIVPLGQLLLKKFHTSDLMISMLFGSIPAGLTIIIWPIVSVWSDRTRSRWGRRIPSLFWPTPVVTGAMVGVAYSPPSPTGSIQAPAEIYRLMFLLAGLTAFAGCACWLLLNCGFVHNG